ncbi:MAG: DUF4166 domain-containing protein [Caulobacteraceae bacterium]|nr:DUF4166 domain-containing protein [Caulobacteraceae bacterium]
MDTIVLRPGALGRARRRARGRRYVDHHPDFRSLVGEAAWADLPLAVRERFTTTATRTYEGRMAVRASAAGFLFAQLCRLIGTPLAPWRGEDTPVSVKVWMRGDGAMVWDRLYRFSGRAPAKVGSCKKADRRGLVEVVRGGLGMALDVTVEDHALHFRSRGYFWEVLGARLPLPELFTPGAAHVFHRDEGDGRFTFGLRFHHAWLGETFWQEGVFSDP